MASDENIEIPKAIIEHPYHKHPDDKKSINEKIQEMDKLYGSIEIGAASDMVLKALDPIVEMRLGHLLDRLAQAPPELGAILDIRAQICETWRIRKQLKEAGKNGKNAMNTIKNIFSV